MQCLSAVWNFHVRNETVNLSWLLYIIAMFLESAAAICCALLVSEAYNRSPWSPPPPPSHNTSCQGIYRHLHVCHLYYLIPPCLLLQLHAWLFCLRTDSLSMHLSRRVFYCCWCLYDWCVVVINVTWSAGKRCTPARACGRYVGDVIMNVKQSFYSRIQLNVS